MADKDIIIYAASRYDFLLVSFAEQVGHVGILLPDDMNPGVRPSGPI
jgi:hypothetical protein